MDDKDSRISQILAHLASAAATAADGVTEVVQSAGATVSDTYSAVKLNMELSRLHEEQAKLFKDIGHTMFLIKVGQATEHTDENGDVIDAQQTVDQLLLLAEGKQEEMDRIGAELKRLNGQKVCPVCGKVCDRKDAYCSACGSKLPSGE